MNVFELISEQQKGKENTAIWMVGEQLKDILRIEPEHTEIIERDLKIEGMAIDDAEKKIHEYANKQPRGKGKNCVCVPPNVAEDIIREFYGLPKKKHTERAEPIPQRVSLFDMM